MVLVELVVDLDLSCSCIYVCVRVLSFLLRNCNCVSLALFPPYHPFKFQNIKQISQTNYQQNQLILLLLKFFIYFTIMMKLFSLFACSVTAIKIHAPDQMTVTMMTGDILEFNADEVQTVRDLNQALSEQNPDLLHLIEVGGKRYRDFSLTKADGREPDSGEELEFGDEANLDLFVNCDYEEFLAKCEELKQKNDYVEYRLTDVKAQIEQAQSIIAQQKEHLANGIHSYLLKIDYICILFETFRLDHNFLLNYPNSYFCFNCVQGTGTEVPYGSSGGLGLGGPPCGRSITVGAGGCRWVGIPYAERGAYPAYLQMTQLRLSVLEEQEEYLEDFDIDTATEEDWDHLLNMPREIMDVWPANQQ